MIGAERSAPSFSAARALAPSRSAPLAPLPDERLADAFEALADLGALETPLDAADHAASLLEQLVPARLVRIALYDIDDDVLRFVVSLGPGAEVARAIGLRGRGIVRAAAREGVCVRVDDVDADPRFDASTDTVAGVDAVNVFVAPIASDARLRGAVQLVNRKSQPAFSSSDAAVASYVASRLAAYFTR